MHTFLNIAGIYLLVSVPFCILVGKFIAFQDKPPAKFPIAEIPVQTRHSVYLAQ